MVDIYIYKDYSQKFLVMGSSMNRELGTFSNILVLRIRFFKARSGSGPDIRIPVERRN